LMLSWELRSYRMAEAMSGPVFFDRKELDLILTSCTSPAHLAGALARPVWIVLPFMPDYRWLMQRSDTPWYPTARLFRQTAPSNWRPVMTELVAALSQLAAAGRGAPAAHAPVIMGEGVGQPAQLGA